MTWKWESTMLEWKFNFKENCLKGFEIEKVKEYRRNVELRDIVKMTEEEREKIESKEDTRERRYKRENVEKTKCKERNREEREGIKCKSKQKNRREREREIIEREI